MMKLHIQYATFVFEAEGEKADVDEYYIRWCQLMTTVLNKQSDTVAALRAAQQAEGMTKQ